MQFYDILIGNNVWVTALQLQMREVPMYYFIVNPNAHGGRGEKIWKKLERQIRKSGISYEAYQTENPGDARRIAAQLTADMQEEITIVAVGGDGTVNEVLNGLSIGDSLTVGYIPTGSGNDLARGLNNSRNPGKCLKRILNPEEICRVDYGILSYEDEEPVYRRFMVSSGIGFDAAVCHRLLDRSKPGELRQIPGRGRYILAGLKQLLTAKASRGYLILDGVRRVEFNHIYFVSVHNHGSEGGGFLFAPKAVFDDGELELCVAHTASKLRLLPVLLDAYRGHLGRRRGVHFYRCKEAVIHVEQPMPVHADGENCYCQNELRVRCVKQKLRMIL